MATEGVGVLRLVAARLGMEATRNAFAGQEPGDRRKKISKRTVENVFGFFSYMHPNYLLTKAASFRSFQNSSLPSGPGSFFKMMSNVFCAYQHLGMLNNEEHSDANRS